MITPATVADWSMFAGVLGVLAGLGAFGYRSMLEGTPAERFFGDAGAESTASAGQEAA